MTLDDIEFYSVIYSFDCSADRSVNEYKPRSRKFKQTEGDAYYEGPWKKGKHRKYGALLTAGEFRAFIDDACLIAEDVETMGSIGAPGFGFSWAPAISFNYSRRDVYANAYVTPIPKGDPPETPEESDALWGEIRRVVIDAYD